MIRKNVIVEHRIKSEECQAEPEAQANLLNVSLGVDKVEVPLVECHRHRPPE